MDRSYLRSIESPEDASVTSIPAVSIDFFLSHSWSANGFWKQVALFLCCSTTSTYIIALIPSSLLAARLLYASFQNRTGLGWTVQPNPAWTANGFDLTVFTFGFVSFLLGLIIIPLFKHRNTIVFLDKCCIPQNDPIAKAYGISRLADYLRVSNKLLILWSPDYLERLWCVYELAVFLRFHKKEEVILVNLNHLELCMSLMIVQSFSIVTLLLIEPWKPDLVYIVCGIYVVIFYHML
ncbi:hypothetical protein FOZ60_011302 [Perkinsus olseni]|uniref:TIR domain-containing protein n=1 Tax=Perkinsus olseni TaxID=32597 RepID=A0A7J6PBH8_PEROL|nr:hypothetical protein FOZ60_011302 [Perkinsus olseni]